MHVRDEGMKLHYYLLQYLLPYHSGLKNPQLSINITNNLRRKKIFYFILFKKKCFLK